MWVVSYIVLLLGTIGMYFDCKHEFYRSKQKLSYQKYWLQYF